LFRSAAIAHGPSVVGVILTGTLDDGTAGLWEIKQRGGKSIVQDPKDALFPDMPRHALEHVPIDHVTSLKGLAPLLIDIVGQTVRMEANSREEPMTDIRNTALTCPECRGPISKSRQGPIIEYACRIGHRYSPASFLAAHAETRERALWAAVVALEEGAELAQDIAARSTLQVVQGILEHEATGNAHAARKIRDLLRSLNQEDTDRLIQQSRDASAASLLNPLSRERLGLFQLNGQRHPD
jgi:two-component system chemotaxis response regulator CheB